MRLFRCFAGISISSVFVFFAGICSALDNPDAPDYLRIFHAESDRYEQAIDNAQSGKVAAEARGKYALFLDNELNKVYRLLLEKLSPEQKKQLQDSERAWAQYRDLESNFIEANWSVDNFGASAVMSRFYYKALLTRQRIEQLSGYLKNY